MECQKCGSKISITDLEVRRNSVTNITGEPRVEIGIRCPDCQADYAMFVGFADLVSMD